MHKTTIARETIIEAPKEKVWAALADFGHVSNMSPNVVKSYSTSKQKNGVGATRHCDFASLGAQVEEKIIEWNEGESLTIDIYESKNIPMVSNMLAHFSLKAQEDHTVLAGIFTYETTSPFGNTLNSLFLKKANEKTWDRFQAGIKRHVETGEKVNPDTELDTTPVKELQRTHQAIK